LFVVLPMMLHPAQELEPPAKPERFTPQGEDRQRGHPDEQKDKGAAPCLLAKSGQNSVHSHRSVPELLL